MEVESLNDVPDLLEAAFRFLGRTIRSRSKGQGPRAKGEARGRKDLLLKQFRIRFGDESGKNLESVLQAVQSIPTLDRIGAWIVTCESAEEVIAKIRQVSH